MCILLLVDDGKMSCLHEIVGADRLQVLEKVEIGESTGELEAHVAVDDLYRAQHLQVLHAEIGRRVAYIF